MIKHVNQTKDHSQLNKIITLAKDHNLTQTLFLSKELPPQKLNTLLFSLSKAKNEIEFIVNSSNTKTHVIAKAPALPSDFIVQSVATLISSGFTLHELE